MEKGSKLESMWSPRKGGNRAAMFVYIMSGLENIGYVAIMVSLVLYFLQVMHYDLSESANLLTNLAGVANLLTIVGGFISDAYMTRLNTVLVLALFEILGYIVLAIQAHSNNLRPDAACITCKLDGGNQKLLYLSLSLLALGCGGIRGVIPSLGADQFDKNNPKEKQQQASFFNWFLMSMILGGAFGTTVIVWISTTKHRWATSFFISLVLAFLGFAFLACGKPFYRGRVPGDSPLLSIFRVVVMAIRNRKLELPEGSDELYEINDAKEVVVEKIPHTEQFRSLDKAAIIPEGASKEKWEACTVTKVEEVKILTRMLPILCSTILMNTCLAQLQTFSVQQGVTMDLNLGSITIPSASIPFIPLVFMSILVPLYELAFVPFVRRFTGHPTGITNLQRVGVGLVLSIISMAISAVIELKRRNAFNREHKVISVFWLSLQYGVFGVADMFTFVGLLEFFYSEAPAGMRSLSTSFTNLSLSVGYFLSSAFVRIVESATAKMSENGQGWLYGLDLNKNHLDRFYWFLAVLSCINFVVYVFCAKWYKYREDDQRKSVLGVDATMVGKIDDTSKEKVHGDHYFSGASEYKSTEN